MTAMVIPTVPTEADLPNIKHTCFDIVPPSDGRPPVNILILLHGLGDTKEPFTILGRNLRLPETACLSLQGLLPLPELFTGADRPSFHWGEDIILESTRGNIDQDAGFGKTTRFLQCNVLEPLISACHFAPRNIFFFGFGQGAMAALNVAATNANVEYGGIVSVGGPLSSAVSVASSDARSKTPVLICGGKRNTNINNAAIDRLNRVFANTEHVKWDRSGDGMMQSREEMLPLMRFWAGRLRSRAGVSNEAMEL